MTIFAMILEATTKWKAGDLWLGLFILDFIALVIFGVHING